MSDHHGSISSNILCSDSYPVELSSLQSSKNDFNDYLVRSDNTFRCTKNVCKASICLKLTVFVGLLVVLSSGVPALALWFKTRQELVQEIERRLITVSTLRQEQLRDYMQSELDKTELIATRILINNYLLSGQSSNKSVAEFDLNSAVDVISDFISAAIYNTHGELVLQTTNDGITTDVFHHRDHVSVHKLEKLMMSYPVRSSYGWVYNVSRPIYMQQKIVGVLITWINATKLASLVYDRTGLQETGELLIGIPDGMETIRFLFPPSHNPELLSRPNIGAMALAIKGESGVMTMHDYVSVKVIAAYRPVGFMQWGLLAKLNIHEAYEPVQSVETVIITTIVVLFFVGVLASLAIAKVFTSPIYELCRAAAALGEGDMTARVKSGTVMFRDEISDLKDAFNSMADQISGHRSLLEQKVRERTSDLAHANCGLAKEIEERKKIEMELEKAKDAAIAANRSKSEFLANMSHEIRTPLNAIINFTELCRDTDLTPEQKEHLDYVHFAAQHLLRLITDILDFSKIEAGKLEVEEIQFSLYDQLEHAVSVLAARAWTSGIELSYNIGHDVPDHIYGDPGRLTQILVNLIGNAIKFTNKGDVIITVSVRQKTSEYVEFLFAVKDSGLGIPKSKQSQLFQAFSQLDSSTQRLYGGTGLGLEISYRLAVAMGGSMWVESDGLEGQGSTFWFTVRFRVSQTCQLSSMDQLFKDVYGLVVDDNYSSRSNLVDILRSWGIQVNGVESVELAISALDEAVESGHKYNVVLLDMWLNGTDASEFVSFLHRKHNLLETQNFPQKISPSIEDSCKPDHVTSSIIMLTSVNPADTVKCKELGIQHHLSKPVKRSLLLKILRSVLQAENPPISEDKPTQQSKIPFKGLHILVAEDNVVNQRVVLSLLQKWGHTAVLANNGEEAVAMASNGAFDLILMDVQMPICDGLKATARIRNLEVSHAKKPFRTPIVAMTAHAMSDDAEQCFQAGMDFYISKPLNSKKLQQLLQDVSKGSIKWNLGHGSPTIPGDY